MQISYEKLKLIISKHSSILIVHGKSSFTKSGLDKFLTEFHRNKEIYNWSVESTDPDAKEIKNLSSYISDNRPSIIISCGGGTVIDTAKAASFISSQGLSLVSLLEGNRNEDCENIKQITIPTTCGTGSECTHFSVIYINGIKHSLADLSMKPDYFYLDARFLKNLPKKHIVSSSLDAFSQSIESFWAKSSTEESKRMSIAGMELFSQNYHSLTDNNNLRSLNLMLECANRAGQAINITKTTAPHAISYHLSKELNLPHGFSVFLTLPEIFEYTISSLGDDYELEKKIIYKSMGVKDSLAAFSFLKKLRKESAAHMKLTVLSSKDMITLAQDAASAVNQERLSNHPAVLDQEAVSSLTLAGLKKVFQ